ncbi:MAG: hypothetical protein ACOYYS_19230 [Chloroflexota bacterium]
MTQLEYARQMAEKHPQGPASWLTNQEALALLEDKRELEENNQILAWLAMPAPTAQEATP